jgi:hypothetical protein
LHGLVAAGPKAALLSKASWLVFAVSLPPLLLLPVPMIVLRTVNLWHAASPAY